MTSNKFFFSFSDLNLKNEALKSNVKFNLKLVRKKSDNIQSLKSLEEI